MLPINIKPIRFLGILAGIIVVAVVAGLTFKIRVDQHWTAMQTWAEEQRLAWEHRKFQRSPLWGESLPGNAWEAYDQAFAACADHVDDGAGGILNQLINRQAQVSQEEQAAILKRWSEPLQLLQAGAHCSDNRRAVVWENGFSNVMIHNLLTARSLSNAAHYQALVHLEAGRGAAAVQILLDAATMGADFTHAPLLIEEMIGIALVAIPIHALESEFLDGLNSEALELLASGLAKLDDHFTLISENAFYEVLLLAYHKVGAEEDDEWDELPTARYGFSKRLMKALCVQELRNAYQDLASKRNLSWSDRQDYIQRRGEIVAQSDNPMTGMFIAPASLISVEQIKRQTVAKLRMLRMEVDHRLGRQVVPLPDPLGDADLTFAVHEDGIRINSAGKMGNRPLQRPMPPR